MNIKHPLIESIISLLVAYNVIILLFRLKQISILVYRKNI